MGEQKLSLRKIAAVTLFESAVHGIAFYYTALLQELCLQKYFSHSPGTALPH